MVPAFPRSLAAVLMILCCCNSQLVVDYDIALFNGEVSRLATLVWLSPAYCLFEKWVEQRGGELTMRSSASVQVELLREDNATFVLPQRYSVPFCNDFSPKPAAVSTPLAYQMGPNVACIDGSCIEHVLPGQRFRVRYIIYSVSEEALVTTKWSAPIATRDDPPSYSSIDADTTPRSGAMVVITTVLVVALFLLLLGFASMLAARSKFAR
ncbi:uroplakin-2 [Callorhinchus milii]|uniref:Uroplakin-2-like n=1 Tax=Callorhinchus milii TaxID=7868 RepID=A0A4W3KF39_CALMI|nr:uroplakin-2 [Callorhinchus milii]XP_007909013.1 uroplakin-2 [Callorhinchus milii]|eukprot:gi/632984178/ref/XP_007909011.1/ PREDICTED: uroplakin-2-like [Callorhinchus milii]